MTTEKPTADILLRAKANKSLERRHPWIFSGAIQRINGHAEDGDIVRLVAADGTPAALGYWNSQSEIQVRVLTWNIDEDINTEFWQDLIDQAIERRLPIGDATRLINAENDFIPGLVVDKYGDWLVLQALSLGIDNRKMMLAELLGKTLQVKGVYERSDVDIRDKEGLDDSSMVLWGEAPPTTVVINENGIRYHVDIVNGHKTGFYLDQQENRRRLTQWLAEQPNASEMTVLNTFCYTGGFSLAALAGGVGRSISVDSSDAALALARENATMNGYAVNDEDFIEANVFDLLRTYRDSGQQFDVIVLDPPKFARHARQVNSASRGYKDINWLAFRLLKPGGVLWTFSCSNAISDDLFQKIVFGALIDAGRDGQIIGKMGASADHPVALTFPEGSYLKGLVCRVR